MNHQRISGTTRIIALLGDPVAHSISPQIHNHAFATMGLDYAYIPMRVDSSQLGTVVSALRACGFAGANVTIPHKQSVMGLCDRISPLSQHIGAVNTLYFDGSHLTGTSTDAQGFFAALHWMGCDPTGSDIVILGNGGTARTLAFACALQKKPRSLTLIGRDLSRVSSLAQSITTATGSNVGHSTFDSPQCSSVLARASLLVNCTSAGMHPDIDLSPVDTSMLSKTTTVFDTIYNPIETTLLRQARAIGCPCQNGLRMLLYQACASFTLWTGATVSEEIFSMDELVAAIDQKSAITKISIR